MQRKDKDDYLPINPSPTSLEHRSPAHAWFIPESSHSRVNGDLPPGDVGQDLYPAFSRMPAHRRPVRESDRHAKVGLSNDLDAETLSR
jgi:hypothetical protein